MTTKRAPEGTAHHVDPERKINSPAPRVSRYTSGANTHGVRQRQPSAPAPGETSGNASSGGPNKGHTGR